MSKINVLPADTYIVINKTILTDQDRRFLISFYQPIIGSDATNLYLTLWSYLDKDETLSLEWTHHHLMTSMKQKLSVIMDGREKLEAIGLLKTYLKKDHANSYIYELYSPLSAYEFLNNPILSVALYNNIGKSEYDKLVNYYKLPKINKSAYEDITSRFNDVFASSPMTHFEKIVDDMKHHNKRDLDITSKIDLDNIFSMIPEDLLNIKGITKDVRELINKLSFIYNFNDTTISDIIRNSINEKRLIDKELLRLNARNYYKFENGGNLPSIIYKEQPEYLRSQSSEVGKRAKMIYQFETTSPYDYLVLKNGGNKPINNDLLILEHLLVDLELTAGVTNVLVDYVLKINSNKLTRNFIEAIATQWKRSNIKTVDEAMKFAEAEQEKRKTTSKKKVVSKPDWLDKTIEVDTPTDEEKKHYEELLKKFK
jgi:replication initiation and membrane attachment protein